MKVLVSGGTGFVGRYIVEELLSSGYSVTVGGRHPPKRGFYSRMVDFMPLSLDPDLDQIDAFVDAYFFVHAAFHHEPGLYRGGEGDDPVTFRRLNLDGTVRLFETAMRAGTRRCVFLSSRAVYGDHPAGTTLHEDMVAEPKTLYGQVKIDASRSLRALSSPSFVTSCLHLTGVYGDLRPNKWDGLFADYLAGTPVTPRASSEVHGRDAAQAVRLMLETEQGKINGNVFNVSDVVTDTHAILSSLKAATGCPHPLPDPADTSAVNTMATDKLRKLGWSPGGTALLAQTIRTLASQP